MKVFYKHHGLNYFGQGYWRGIDCAENYLMQIQYPHKGIRNPKPTRKAIPLRRYSINTMD
jgi:hypothetical protein